VKQQIGQTAFSQLTVGQIAIFPMALGQINDTDQMTKGKTTIGEIFKMVIKFKIT
jgi:hypothetical protein